MARPQGAVAEENNAFLLLSLPSAGETDRERTAVDSVKLETKGRREGRKAIILEQRKAAGEALIQAETRSVG